MNKSFLLALSLFASASASAAVDTQYDDLVRLARTGDTAPVLQYLKQHESSQSLQQREDNIVIASWAGLDQDVMAAYARYPQSERLAPDVLATVARAYRNEGQYGQAAALYRKAQQQAPNDPQWVMGEMLVLADDDKGVQASALGMPWLDRLQGKPLAQMRTVMAYALLASGERYEALHQMERAFVTEYPGDFEPELRERYGQVLTRGEMPMAALSMDAGLTPLQRLQKQSDEMALRVRVATVGSRQESERFQATDEALARYASLLKQCDMTPGAEGIARQMRIDRLGLYEGRGMSQRVVSEYDALAAQEEVPAYAKVWVARSLLKLRQPEQAERIMAEAIKAAEGSSSSPWVAGRMLHAEALTQCDRISEARTEIERVMPLIGQYRWVINYPRTEIDPSWLALHEKQASLLGSQARKDDALAHSETLCRLHLNTPGACVQLADMYLGYGWPRRSEQRLKLVEGLAPRAPEVEQSQAYTALALREWHQADLLVADVAQRYPEEDSVRRLVRTNDIAHMAEFQLSAGRGHSHSHGQEEGGNPVRGNNDHQLEATLYSPRFADHWRVFTGIDYTSGDFGTDADDHSATDHNRWQRLGVEYSDRDTVATLEASRQHYRPAKREDGDSSTLKSRTGIQLSIDRDVSDSWHYGAAYAFRTTDTPLRAQVKGIWSTQGEVHARWTPSDETSVSLSLSPRHSSDGNWRWQSSLSGSQRLWGWTYGRLDGLLTVSGTRNSLTHIAHPSDVTPNRTGPDYYSPKQDIVIMPGLRLTHSLYRRYDRQWEHYLELGAGRYYEDYTWCDSATECHTRHDNTPLWMARYGHNVQLSDVLSVGASAQVSRQSYDSVSEREVQLMLDMNYRF